MNRKVIINGVTYETEKIQTPLADDPSQMAVFPETSDANATADDIKNGKTAYVNGKKVTGSHTDPALSLANGVLTIQ